MLTNCGIFSAILSNSYFLLLLFTLYCYHNFHFSFLFQFIFYFFLFLFSFIITFQYHILYHFREASLLLKSWITANTKTFGLDHVETLSAKRYHAVCLGKLGKDEEAATIFREILSR